jgi:hypothetical protein
MNVTSEYFSAKKDNVNKQFNHFTGVDENCQAFNNKNMWDLDQANSFSGFKKGSNGSGFNNTCGNSFSGNKTIDQTLNAAGTSDGVCGDGVNVCPSGEMCVDGRCQPARRGGLNSQVNRKSRRTSQDRISNKPVMGTPRKSSFSAAEKVFPYGTGNNFGGEASARCGLDR